MNILVIGGTGTVGSLVVQGLLSRGEKVREQNVESIKIIMKDGKIYKNTLN